MTYNGTTALRRLLELPWQTCLDIGAGDGWHSRQMSAAGRSPTALDLAGGPGVLPFRYEDFHPERPFDALWVCHCLEHQQSPGAFLEKMHRDLAPDGWLAITVPPLKHNIVGGHLTLWNAGLLLYNLVMARFDCRAAMVKTVDYDVSVIVQHREIPAMPPLRHDNGDIETLAEFFPRGLARQGFDGRIAELNWRAP